ncbi:DUF1702 family protein [Nocardiopsis halophila]|uniref:DUF1702 family protein n=1 Tax=Nocardiopsis halophila TaxID=141692 RepID=UPI00034A84AF|nr:DUF1702 family protein [Nocardiopsis halophila]
MPLSPGSLIRPFFGLDADSFPKLAAERFGPQEDMDRTWRTFEPVARTLVDAFSAALDTPRHEDLVPRLDAVDPELRGIAYEGAGMGLMLLDSLVPGRRRLPRFVHGPGAPYRCLVYIGAGLVLPRVPARPDRFLRRQDPFLRWLVMDGYGFHDGFFAWRRTVEGRSVPRDVRGYARRAFDQGVGRSLWFSTGAGPDRIIATIDGFPASRRADLWSGIGLACAYAAGVMDRDAVRALLEAAREHAADIAVGTALASVFREQSGLVAPHTDVACDVVWGQDAAEVAATAHRAGRGLRDAPGRPAYEHWRQRIRDAWPHSAPAPSSAKELHV